MFPNVTAKDQSLKDKLKQRKWQDRFAVKTGIPDYSPLKDKHTITYRKLLNGAVPKEKYQSTPNKQKQNKTYFQKKVQLFENLKSTHPVYLSHLQEFEDFLTSSKLPNFYIYYSVLPLINQIDVNGFILKMRKGIKEQNSSYHRISTAIKVRQQCLGSLKNLVSKLKDDFSSSQQQKHSFKSLITDFRILTVNTIDQIKRWRDSLNLKQDRAIFYSDNNQNYLIKILNDNQFIFNSVIGQFINFAQKNDPFIIVPLKRAEGKQSSQFLELLDTQKNLAYYQKHMQYLASQKAYQMTLIPPSPAIKREPKYPQIQKIYKSKSTAKFQSFNKKQNQFEQLQKEAMQRQKIRQQRIKKNQQRINAIKSVYQSYTNKIKLKQIKKQNKKLQKVQTDVEQKVKKDRQKYNSRQKSKNSLGSQQDFERMVKNKLQKQKNKKLIFDQKIQLRDNQVRDSKSLIKLPRAQKTQDRMIQNLKQIQQTLKSKLNFMHEQGKKQQTSVNKLSMSSERFHKKSNQTLISQLKSQIIKNLQIQSQQRQNQRARRRQQQQKAIQQIKIKMKRQMQQKMQQKKRQKMIQRQQLQKKLRQQQNRLNKQRQLQIQLQVKLAKQKQLRQLQKIKRQSLQREMRFKQQLQRQQKLRRQRQQQIQRQKRDKQRILQQLKRKELKQQLQKQIKNEMKSRYGQNPKLYDKQQMNIIRNKKQQQLTKQIQLLKMKQNQQIQQIRRQNELRQRMIKLKKQQQQLKRKQVQHLMKSVIQQQKQDINRESIKKRIQLQQQIKNNAKTKLLEQYKLQKLNLLQQNKKQKQLLLQQDIYRQKIKQKIQKQLRIQAIQKTKKQLDQRQNKKYQINMKLQQSKSKFNQSLNIQLNKQQIQSQVKKQLIQKVIFDKQAQRQAAKNDLRSQFQRQLMSSAISQIYQQNANNPIMKKNIEKFKGDDYLRNKMNQIDITNGNVEKPTNQKPIIESRQDIFNSILSQSPKKLTKNYSMINSITNQQKQMYSKKKKQVDQMRSQPSYKLPKKLSQEENQGFQIMNVQKQQKDSQFDVKIIKKSSIKKKQDIQEKQYTKKKPKKKQQQDSQDQQKISKRNKSIKKRPSKKKYQSDEEDSQDKIRSSPNKKKISPKKRRQSDQALSSDSQQQRILIKKQSRKSQNRKKLESRQKQVQQLKYSIRKSESIRKDESPIRLTRKSSKRSDDLRGGAKVYFDAQIPTKLNQMIPEQQKIQLRQVKHTAQSKYEIKLEAIPQRQLDEYLAGHFSQLPQVQRLIQLFDRQQLYRKLINELTFCMLLGYQKNVIIGLALAFHDRNKTDTRKFTIVHFAAYHNEDVKDFLMSCVNYIFKKDPVDEIQFHYKFDQSQQQQASYSNDFNKWFDKFGNVYQKKVDDNIFQRKYHMKRQFNQKCQVVLGGVNKNTFRNLFSVYCGVVMSDSDMIQFKQQLRDVVTPENQISYSIAIAQLFRTYLTPDQAEALKAKVKQFAKLKQLLILVVMLQKKKVKMDQLKLSEFKNMIQLNMKLMSQGKDVIRYCKDSGLDLGRIYFAQLSQAFNLPFNFQTTSLPIEAQATGKVHQISYFRLSPLPPNKLHIIKSSLYNAELHLLPTQNTKYKLFVINAQQYNQIKQTNHLDVFMYIRLFLKNVKSHNTASWKYVWLPQMSDKANFSVRQFKSFLNKDIYCHDSINISYKQFLPNALIIQPEHRDLVITPPFIVGIMSMTLEQVTEGSPLYARMIDVPALRTLQIQE